jgi:hypothetical protein
LDEVIHNPAMMGAIELEEATRRAEQTRHKSHEEGAGRNLLKTAAHDHILTSNAANTALAYAWPLINKSPPSPSLQVCNLPNNLTSENCFDIPPIIYYWTVPLILDHSYLFGKLTS